MTVLNTIVAEQLNIFKVNVDARIKKGDGKDEAILKELQALIKQSKVIRFEGNGYGDEWVKEAKKRGLSNMRTSPEALEVWGRKEVIALFEDLKVLKPEELAARREIEYEKYMMKRQIEAVVACDLAQNTILPAAISYQNFLLENIMGIEEAFAKKGSKMVSPQRDILERTSSLVNDLYSSMSKLKVEMNKANSLSSHQKQAEAYGNIVTPLIEELGESCTALEGLIDNELWPLPKFTELLFTR